METQTTAIAVVESEKLDVIVKQSGLPIEEGETIKQSYQPYLIQLAEIHEQASKINFTNPAELDETIARNLRLKTVKIRTDSEKLKDSRKRTYLLRGNLEQAAYNLIAATCKVAEDQFVQVEKAREIAEAKRVEALRIARTEELSRYDWVDTGVMNVGKLDDSTFAAMLSGLKKQYEDRIEAERKAEEERQAALKAAEEERLRMIAENERLRKEAEEKERAMAIERAKAEAERKEAEEKARKEREAAEKKLAEERAKAESERRRIEAENAKILEEERKERERIAAELKVKQDAEEAERQRKEKEERDRIAAEKKAAAAPDKQKLLTWAGKILIPAIGELKTDAAKQIYNEACRYITNTAKYVKTEAEKL